MRYVRAGHTHPLLVGPDAGEWQVVKSGGMMIGVARGETFAKSLEELTIELRPGQAFIQYTDGVIEARERGGDEYGTDRVIEYVEKAGDEGTLAELLEGLVKEVDSWTGGAPQEDDISILAVRRSREA
jgi:sigma-B regulation protein RsbU (phosphoserine phosphatase)